MTELHANVGNDSLARDAQQVGLEKTEAHLTGENRDQGQHDRIDLRSISSRQRGIDQPAQDLWHRQTARTRREETHERYRHMDAKGSRHGQQSSEIARPEFSRGNGNRHQRFCCGVSHAHRQLKRMCFDQINLMQFTTAVPVAPRQ